VPGAEADPDANQAASGRYHEAVVAFKRNLLRAALTRANGNRTRAAEALGLQRTYLLRLVKELGIRGPEEEAE
jgi:DNA-binding NtrC family response regulator